MKPDVKVNLKKMRLQLFDTEMNQLEDRLVAQSLELTKGPKEVHKGPLKIELSLFEKPDIDLAIEYLKRISGDIPLVIKTPRLKKSAQAYSDDPSWRDSLFKEVQELDYQDDIIKALRAEGFVFLMADHLSDIGIIPNWDDKADGFKDYQWMIKLIKEAKNPSNNKYDPNLMFGFKLLDGKIEKYGAILHGAEHEFEKPWKSANKLTFRKTEMVKFPHYMVMEERERFRVELYKARKDPDNHKFSKFFRRWYVDVEFKEKSEWANLIEAPTT